MNAVLPKIRFRDPQIEMAHGAGGKASRRLVEGLFAPLLFGTSTEPLGDAAHLDVNGTRIAITADSFVVKPLRFPGGSIGELAVNGTVNDLAVSGARAQALVVTYVLEAGLPTEILEAEVRAMAKAAARAGVTIAGGDTKVVEHGKADRMYITTAGIGRPDSGNRRWRPRPSGPATRCCSAAPSAITASPFCWRAESWNWKRSFVPTPAPCFRWWRPWLGSAAPGIRWMRDPTRGGVATSLNELARDCGLGVMLWEDAIPVRDAVRGACELLGLDPLHIANEGQFLAVVAPEYADAALQALRESPGGQRGRHHRRDARAAVAALFSAPTATAASA